MRLAWGAVVVVVSVAAGCAVRWPRSLTEARDAGEDAGLDAADGADAGDVDGEEGDASADAGDAADAAAEPREDASDSGGGVDSLDADALVAFDVDVPVSLEADTPRDASDVPDVPEADAPAAIDAPDACVGASCVYGSCAELPAGSASGVYTLRALSGTWRGYCDVPTDGSPAWTLVMKIDGARTTFQYDSSHWITTSRLNDTAVDLSEQESKYEGSNATPFREIRLQTNGAAGRRDVLLSTAPAAAPALSLIAVTLSRVTPPPVFNVTSAWANAFPGATLQSACTRFGFNVRPQPGSARAAVRIGGVGDDDVGCGSPDSWVGIGGFVDNPTCTPMGNTLSAGNVSGCDGAMSPRRAASFVWIWVR